MGDGSMCHGCRAYTCECPLDDEKLELALRLAEGDKFLKRFVTSMVKEIKERRLNTGNGNWPKLRGLNLAIRQKGRDGKKEKYALDHSVPPETFVILVPEPCRNGKPAVIIETWFENGRTR